MIVRRVSFVNNGWRELKETIEQFKIPCLPITFGVSEKRLLGYILDEMRSDRPPRYVVVALRCSCVCMQSCLSAAFDLFQLMIIFILRITLIICTSGWVPAKMASSDMLLVNPFVYSFGGEAHDDCFPLVVSHVALVFTSLPRMLASNTFAMNEMRNQNAISESKLFRTDELFKHNNVAWFLTHEYIFHQHGNVWMEDISRLPIEDDRHVHSGACTTENLDMHVKFRSVAPGVGERSGCVCHFEEGRHDENSASMSIQLAHLTRKSSKHGSEDYGYDREGADDGRERRPEEALPLMMQ
ncbi:hypothetical protein T01_12337 [Trichinella spiralis]|uniref:Uncharacterized protein n=1 Tax=Trichinella spiralis TaxID=6334 RepID=A0A0V1AMS1_TRISP|nr:hypothetical protein T01_12337 [Trichinella spiralis]